MNHLHRDLAPITDTGWDLIDDEAKGRLTTYLAARKLVDFEGPHGWSHSATNLGRIATISGPSEGVAGAQRKVLPLVELRVEFKVSRVQLDDADRGATDIDLDELDEAARQIAIGENVTVFHGYQAAGIRGITESTSHAPITYGADVATYPTAVAQAVDVLRQSGIDGPYGLAICPTTYTRIVETAEHGGHLLLDHLHKILGGPLVWSPGTRRWDRAQPAGWGFHPRVRTGSFHRLPRSRCGRRAALHRREPQLQNPRARCRRGGPRRQPESACLTPYPGTGHSLANVESLTISQLAHEAGVHVETVRYYERRGLLREPPRTPAGYRQYSTADLRRLQFIARAKLLGFTLAEVARLAGDHHDRDGDDSDTADSDNRRHRYADSDTATRS